MRFPITLLYTCFFMACSPLWGQSRVGAAPCNLVDLAEMTISRNPMIQRQRFQIDRARADFQIARSAFDYRLRSQAGYDRNRLNLFAADPRFLLANEQLQTHSLNVTGGLQRTFRSGLTANMEVNYTRISDSYLLNQFNQEVGAYFPDNYSSTVFSLTQPLLRGRGKQYAAANESASLVSMESEKLNLLYVSSGELLNMSLAYWQYLTQFESAQIYQQNEDRVRQVLDVTRILVAAEKKPAGDLLQIQADLADKERQKLQANQQLYSARQNLGRYIGLNEAESAQLGTPGNGFPTLEGSGYEPELDLAEFIALAHQNRADLKALDQSQKALEINLNLAHNLMKPQLDLGAFVGYGGADPGKGAGRFATALGETEGRNVQFGVSLNYLFPLNNNAAQGNLVASEVAVSDQQVLIDNQIRNIELNVSIALNDLENSVMTLEKSSQTLAYYQEVFENEQEKFQNGLTTLLNLILFQERLTFAQLDYLRSQQQFAVAILNLRFETGSLIPPGSNLLAPQNLDVFYRLPSLP